MPACSASHSATLADSPPLQSKEPYPHALHGLVSRYPLLSFLGCSVGTQILPVEVGSEVSTPPHGSGSLYRHPSPLGPGDVFCSACLCSQACLFPWLKFRAAPWTQSGRASWYLHSTDPPLLPPFRVKPWGRVVVPFRLWAVAFTVPYPCMLHGAWCVWRKGTLKGAVGAASAGFSAIAWLERWGAALPEPCLVTWGQLEGSVTVALQGCWWP